MRRSEIDRVLDEADDLLTGSGHTLPVHARWDLSTWNANRERGRELARRGIGWDVTDFGSGDFERCGLVAFTLSNAGDEADQVYANKLLVVREGQVTPLHHHWRKMEDIAVLSGGRLQLRLFGVVAGDAVDRERDVRVLVDNAWTTLPAGAAVTLSPGQRVRLEPHHYHEFQAGPGGGTVVAEEVSTRNDDAADNCFVEAAGRFPEIEEDAPPRRLLCTELPGTDGFARLVSRHGLDA